MVPNHYIPRPEAWQKLLPVPCGIPVVSIGGIFEPYHILVHSTVALLGSCSCDTVLSGMTEFE